MIRLVLCRARPTTSHQPRPFHILTYAERAPSRLTPLPLPPVNASDRYYTTRYKVHTQQAATTSSPCYTYYLLLIGSYDEENGFTTCSLVASIGYNSCCLNAVVLCVVVVFECNEYKVVVLG